MKPLLLCIGLLALVSFEARAITYEFVGACDQKPLLMGSLEIPQAISAGEATVTILDKNNIPYIGSELGMNSIFNTPTDKEAIEVLSPTELRAYGWCYEVDGLQPSQMPHEFILNGNEHLYWFYAFSLFKDGQWVTYCEPAFLVKPKALCPQK